MSALSVGIVAIGPNCQSGWFTGVGRRYVYLISISRYGQDCLGRLADWLCVYHNLGLYYGNRWGRRPRPDEHLSLALKISG